MLHVPTKILMACHKLTGILKQQLYSQSWLHLGKNTCQGNTNTSSSINCLPAFDCLNM